MNDDALCLKHQLRPRIITKIAPHDRIKKQSNLIYCSTQSTVNDRIKLQQPLPK